MGLIFVFLVALFWFAVIGGGFYVAVRVVRAVEERGSGRPDSRALAERVARLEDMLDAMGTEVQRLADGQQFTQRLLTERRTPAAGAPAVEDGEPEAPDVAKEKPEPPPASDAS